MLSLVSTKYSIAFREIIIILHLPIDSFFQNTETKHDDLAYSQPTIVPYQHFSILPAGSSGSSAASNIFCQDIVRAHHFVSSGLSSLLDFDYFEYYYFIESFQTPPPLAASLGPSSVCSNSTRRGMSTSSSTRSRGGRRHASLQTHQNALHSDPSVVTA